MRVADGAEPVLLPQASTTLYIIHCTAAAAASPVAASAALVQVAVWGWVVVSAIVMCVALNMAELSSAYTTSGGMY